MKKLTIKNHEVAHLIAGAPAHFPKYTTQLINPANQNAGGTRPKVVGQLSDMIQEFTGKSLDEWRTYSLGQKPDSMEAAAEKIWAGYGGSRRTWRLHRRPLRTCRDLRA